MPKNIQQEGNHVGGDLAAGDINKSYNYYEASKTALRILAEKISEPYSTDEEYRGLIDRLLHYVECAPSKPLRDLSAKLADANRKIDIERATSLKEKFTKKLYKLQFSDAVQNLLCHILAKIEVCFQKVILPKVKNRDISDAEVDDHIYNLIKEIYDEVGVCQVVDMQDIEGMLYFLTGNCHLEWK